METGIKSSLDFVWKLATQMQGRWMASPVISGIVLMTYHLAMPWLLLPCHTLSSCDSGKNFVFAISVVRCMRVDVTGNHISSMSQESVGGGRKDEFQWMSLHWLATVRVWYGIVGFNVPIDTL